MTASVPDRFWLNAKPGRLRHTAADDRVGPHRAGLAPLEVHGAATTPAEALGEPADLGERAAQHLAHVVGQLGQRRPTWPA